MPISFADSLWFVTEDGDLLRLSPHEEHSESVCTFGGGRFGARPLLTRNLRIPFEPDALVAHNDTGVYLADLDSGNHECLYDSTDGTILLSDWASPYTSVAQDENFYYVLGRQAGTAVIVAVSRRDKEATLYPLEQAEVAAGPVVFRGAVLAFGQERIYCLRDGKVLACRWPAGFSPCVSAENVGLSLLPAVGQWPYAVAGGSGVYMLGVFSETPGFVLVNSYRETGIPNPTSIRLEPRRDGGGAGNNGRGLVAQCGDGPVLIVRDDTLVWLDGASPHSLCEADVAALSAPFYDGKSFVFTTDLEGSGKSLLAVRGKKQFVESSLGVFGDYRDGMGSAVCAGRLVHVYAGPRDKVRFLVW